jgi:hypothetical protein
VTSSGAKIVGYEVTYPPSAGLAPETFLTPIDAKKAIRRAGGGTARQLTQA